VIGPPKQGRGWKPNMGKETPRNKKETIQYDLNAEKTAGFPREEGE